MDESTEPRTFDRATVLSSQDVRAAARECGFALVGLARAEPLDSRPLLDWLERGYAADLSAMRRRIEERLDPGVILPGAKTVLVLGIPYGRGEWTAPLADIARYARGRDYHYAHRDRMRRLRGRLLALDQDGNPQSVPIPSRDATLLAKPAGSARVQDGNPRRVSKPSRDATLLAKPAGSARESGLRTYACVDSGAAMEKAWAERAGLGFIGKNGLLINREHGSWFTLSLMVLDRAVDAYDAPHPRACGDCTKCLDACPTQAFASPGVLDARRCLSYHTVENHGEIPDWVRPRMGSRVFGCDICQEVCPFNQGKLPPGDPRQAPRAIGLMPAAHLAALTQAQFDELATGTPMRRIGYHGLRRNACLSLGATRDHPSRALLEGLADDPSPLVAEAARWSLRQLDDCNGNPERVPKPSRDATLLAKPAGSARDD